MAKLALTAPDLTIRVSISAAIRSCSPRRPRAAFVEFRSKLCSLSLVLIVKFGWNTEVHSKKTCDRATVNDCDDESDECLFDHAQCLSLAIEKSTFFLFINCFWKWKVESEQKKNSALQPYST